MEQIVDSAPVLPLLHDPVPEPQLVDSAEEVLKILDKLVPDVEQVIEVPKIIQHAVLQRWSRRRPNSWWKCLGLSSSSPDALQAHSGLESFALLGTLYACARLWVERHRQPRTVNKYWVHDHARQVPAIADQQWMVPLFSSSTELWILPLCYRDRYAQCQTVHFLTCLLTCPLLCMSRSSTTLSWRRGRFPWCSSADH